MGRNKDSLIALAEKLTGETCGEVLTKKDALKKIACFYAGEEVKCNTVADALQCIASHCNGGGGGSSGGSGETITPYAEKVYTGRGYTTALIFDHTQITGECTYTNADGGVSNIDLSTRTTNLYLDAIDIVSFELEINGSKVTVNVNE